MYILILIIIFSIELYDYIFKLKIKELLPAAKYYGVIHIPGETYFNFLERINKKRLRTNFDPKPMAEQILNTKVKVKYTIGSIIIFATKPWWITKHKWNRLKKKTEDVCKLMLKTNVNITIKEYNENINNLSQR